MPRPLQAEIMGDGRRFKTAVVHRRWGKTEMAIKMLCATASGQDCKHPAPRCYYLGATKPSVTRIAWEMVERFAKATGGKPYRTNLTATWPNGGTLELLSAWNWQHYRGIYADALVIDETDLIAPSAFDSVFRPALADRKGWALFIGTPMGKGHLYQRFKAAEASENWASWQYSCRDTDVVDPDELADLEATMPPNDFAREYLVDFDAAVAGAFYADQITRAEDDGRILPLQIDKDQGVTAAWNFDRTDCIVVTLWQRNREHLDCVDMIWEQNTDMGTMRELLDHKRVNIERHVCPGNLRETPKARLDQARRVGIKMKPTEKLEPIDRIYGTKPFLPKARFNSNKCADAIEALRRYRSEYDEINRVFEDKPVNDWCMQVAGSVESMALSFNPKRTDWSKPITYGPTEEVDEVVEYAA